MSLGVDAAREHARFDADAERLARAFWPGPLTLVLPVAPTCRVSLLARAGLDTLALRVPDHPVGPRADRGGRAAAGGALGQPLRPRQSDDRRPCPRRSRRPDRLDPRRRAFAAWPRIDHRRLSRGRADAAASGRASRRRRSRPRSGAGWPIRRSRRAARPTRRGNSPRIMRRTRRLRLGAVDDRRATRRRSISAACWPARRAARASIFRRPATSSRRRRICSPICGRSTHPARRAIAVAPIPARGLGAAINDRLRRAAAPRDG